MKYIIECLRRKSRRITGVVGGGENGKVAGGKDLRGVII